MIKEGIIDLKYFNFETSKVIPFFRRFEVVVGKNISKLVVPMFYLTVHRFLARVKSPTCTT